MIRTHVQDLLDRLDKSRRSGEGWTACCPAHPDTNPSLSINVGDDGKLLLQCHKGCSFESILEALNIKGENTQPKSITPSVRPREVDRYDYERLDGTLNHQVIRRSDKQFPVRYPDRSGGWIHKKPQELIPFRLPQVRAAIQAGEPIHIPEGEKDVLNLERKGFAATCNMGGAGNWTDDYSEWVVDASEIRIIPDNDKDGIDHANKTAQSLINTGVKRVKIVRLPDLLVKGDVSDWFDAEEGTPKTGQVVKVKSSA